MGKYLLKAGDALSQLLNVVFLLGHPNEAVSSRAYRLEHDSLTWHYARRAIDFVFAMFGDLEHCKVSYENDLSNASATMRVHSERNNYPDYRE